MRRYCKEVKSYFLVIPFCITDILIYHNNCIYLRISLFKFAILYSYIFYFYIDLQYHNRIMYKFVFFLNPYSSLIPIFFHFY